MAAPLSNGQCCEYFKGAKPLSYGNDMLSRGRPYVPFWFNDWQNHELFVLTLLVGFLESIILGFSIEADTQTFADERPNNVFLQELPNAPIWYGMEL